MDRLPFAPYDFFGYLASGFALVAGLQLAFGFPDVFGRQLTAAETMFLLLAVYVIGQVLATPAKAILEDLIIRHVLGSPGVDLCREKRPLVRGTIFPGFYTPLPLAVRGGVLDRAKAEGEHHIGEDLFVHVRFSPEIRGDEKIATRLSSFLNQYGFSRNLCFTTLIVGTLLLVRSNFVGSTQMRWYGISSLALSAALFYRYLKFFRQYSYEMFNCYRP